MFLEYKSTPFESELTSLLSPQNPFFKRGEVKLFTHNKTALIGFFHNDYEFELKPYISLGYCISENQADLNICLKKIEEWALEKGSPQILGPINFSTLNSYRLPLKESKATFPGEPQWNELLSMSLSVLNYEPVQSYSSHYIEDPKGIFEWGKKRSTRVVREDDEFETVNFRDLDYSIEQDRVHELINKIFSKNIAYIKPSSFEMNLAYSEEKLNQISDFPFFFVKNSLNEYVGVFMSFIAPNVFKEDGSHALYFKTIGAVKDDKHSEGQIFFHLIHQIFKKYEELNKNIPICFSLMRKGNVPEKVAKMFSQESREYALFRKVI